MTVFERNNSYLFYATKTNPPKPVYFEMNGYDTLLVSYYDKYTIHYHSFEEWDYDPDDDPDVLEIPHCKYNSFCGGGGGGGVGVEDFIAHEGRRFPESNFLNWPWGKSLYQLNLFTM